ncbi:MAG: hypothetical protein B7Y25_03275 [Alphaproteobacteria bacterium 16-39-46]|nr:MAG: hypothetical protein B7Y25_03275 [Alphaproteobacteria bacterium 16-39-46]OZA43359.1 MAG: hypothetical protein B7X84_03385 [Alphaproteobacteria bacterium 17-39-52]HQS83918.1 hypothetical protein [Alphaproteobacteria bacterium]HQS93816.1 hypothetical protein [Alphaproteobacteria bacterium]
MKKSIIRNLVLSAFMMTAVVGVGKEANAGAISWLQTQGCKIHPLFCKKAPPPPPAMSHNQCKHSFNTAKQSAGCTKDTKPADSSFCTGAASAACQNYADMKTWCTTECPEAPSADGDEEDAPFTEDNS